jgi:hypothetical protein
MNASVVPVSSLAWGKTSSSQRSNAGKSGKTSTPSNATPTTVVLDLNRNDVLLGRGTGTAIYEGNIKFRKLIKQYKEEYTSVDTTRHMKVAIANRVLNEIRSRGGRFLRKENKGVYHEVYHEAEEEVALEKVKQALRQRYGCSEKRDDGSSQRKRTVQPKRTVRPASTTKAPSLNRDRSISSQLGWLQMNQLRRVLALQRTQSSVASARCPSHIDSSAARMILLRRAQIAAQKKADLYKHLLTLFTSEETIGASLPVVDRLIPASGGVHRQATSSRPSLYPTQLPAVPQSLLEDLAAYRLARSRNESRQLHASGASMPETACTKLPSGRISKLTSERSPTTKHCPSMESCDRKDTVAALSVLAMAADHQTLLDQKDNP